MPTFSDVVFILRRLIGGISDKDMEHLRACWARISESLERRLWLFLWWAWVRAGAERIPVTRLERPTVRTGTEPDESG